MHLKDSECLVDLEDEEKVQQKLKETIEYIKDVEITLLYNSEKLDISFFSDKVIHKETQLNNYVFDRFTPSWTVLWAYRDTLLDESKLIDLFPVESSFIKYESVG